MASTNPINWSFRPDGRELALGRSDRSVVFYELPSGRVLRRWTEHTVTGGLLAYSPDGTRLAYRDADLARVKVVASDAGRLLATLPHPAHANHFVWNPRRPNLLAVAGEDNAIYLWDVEAGKRTAVLKGEVSNGIVLAYPPRRRGAGQPGLVGRAQALGHSDRPDCLELAVELVLDARIRPDRHAG